MCSPMLNVNVGFATLSIMQFPFTFTNNVSCGNKNAPFLITLQTVIICFYCVLNVAFKSLSVYCTSFKSWTFESMTV